MCPRFTKSFVCADAASGLVHMHVGTPGNAVDVTQVHSLLYGGETVVLGDDGYQGVEKRIKNQGPSMQSHVAMKRTLGTALPTTKLAPMRKNSQFSKLVCGPKSNIPFS